METGRRRCRRGSARRPPPRASDGASVDLDLADGTSGPGHDAEEIVGGQRAAAKRAGDDGRPGRGP